MFDLQELFCAHNVKGVESMQPTSSMDNLKLVTHVGFVGKYCKYCLFFKLSYYASVFSL